MVWEWLSALLGGDKHLHVDVKNRNHKNVHKNTTTSADNSEHSSTQTSSQTVNGNVYNLTFNLPPGATLGDEERRILQPIINAFENKQVSLIADDSSLLVNDVLQHEEDDDVRGLLKFFKSKLKPADYYLLRTGLYIKHLREVGRLDEVKRLWNQVAAGKSLRDRRVLELAATEYFSTFFRPFYKELMRANKEHAQKRFDKEIENILDDVKFAVFVHSQMTVQEITDKVMNHAVYNIKYGVKFEIIAIHATGKSQVNRVKAAVKELKETFPIIKVSTVPRGTDIIKAEVYYRKNLLDPETFEDQQ